MKFDWMNIAVYILTVALGALSVYFKRSAAAQSKAVEIESWISEIKSSAAKYIAAAEREFEGTQRGGEKFEWVVNYLHSLLPLTMKSFITREIIGGIVQSVFDGMADYAAVRLDRVLGAGSE